MSIIIHKLDKIHHSITSFSEYSGRLIAWLVLLMALLVCYDVSMRYLFQAGSVALQELEWHLFALIFLLGAAYTLKHNDHVRVDVFYQSKLMTPQRRAMVDLFGGLFFLTPFCLLIIYSSWPFVAGSFAISETSPDPGGLSHRYLIKAAIPLGFSLLLLQGFADMLRNTLTLLNHQQEKS